MSAWHGRSIEERNLLNPAFCAVLLREVAQAYETELDASQAEGLPLPLAFLSASFVLRGDTRELLPLSIRTPIASWMTEHPLERSAVAKGVEVVRPYVRDAIVFGVRHGALRINRAKLLLRCVEPAGSKTKAFIKQATPEVRDCFKRAEFVGRWLRRGGDSMSVLALFGVKP